MDQNDLSTALYRKMCVNCMLRELCHPSCNSRNLEAMTKCLEGDGSLVVAARPRQIGHRTFHYAELLPLRIVASSLRTALIDKTWGVLKGAGLIPDPMPDNWMATVTTCAHGYIVRVYDREVYFP